LESFQQGGGTACVQVFVCPDPPEFPPDEPGEVPLFPVDTQFPAPIQLFWLPHTLEPPLLPLRREIAHCTRSEPPAAIPIWMKHIPLTVLQLTTTGEDVTDPPRVMVVTSVRVTVVIVVVPLDTAVDVDVTVVVRVVVLTTAEVAVEVTVEVGHRR